MAEDTIVTRPRLSVSMRALPPGAAAFLLALAAGRSFEASIGAGFAETEAFAPADAIAVMLECGAFTTVGAPPDGGLEGL